MIAVSLRRLESEEHLWSCRARVKHKQIDSGLHVKSTKFSDQLLEK